MTPQDTRAAIKQALAAFDDLSLRESAVNLFDALGYHSDRQIALENDPDAFLDMFDKEERLNSEKALFSDWQSVDLLFQLTEGDVAQQVDLFNATRDAIDNSIIESYLFAAVDLSGDSYTRTQLAQITREINKLFAMPVMVLYRYNGLLTLAIIHRRLHKRDASRDVLEKVTLIKDIQAAQPHRAHIEILYDLSLPVLSGDHGFTNFVELHKAWQRALDSSELNKRFFREIANWYFWAVREVTFPADAGPDETRNATSVIRLITRLIFVWFLKEKGLVPDDLFSQRRLDDLLTWADPQDSTYYKAILQNLFFATLNQEMNTPQDPDNRKFRGKGKSRDQHYAIHNVYRYEEYFTDPARALGLFASVPFLNGGLFECLDRRTDDGIIRIDGFSDRKDNPLRVPDELFFGDEQSIDLNDTYDTSGRTYRVQGLINILHRYKFTIDENTPIEEEVALDPELLGKVFENLLAAYNPETGTTARKATGSFYTPREIVNYMVDEALLAYLASQTSEVSETSEASVDDRLRHLLAYNDEPHQFSEAEVTQLIAAIDRVNILDPACGSGAFPMGILHKLVFILGKLDPGNVRWKARQLTRAAEIEDPDIRRRAMTDIEETFTRNKLDYGRKLYLIENCIYGVDIQPIAVQIAKLRFFISLVVDQRVNEDAPNRGILPLPNLETKFVAANALLGIDRPQQLTLRDPAVAELELQLEDVRHRYFTARTPSTKAKYREKDAQLRDQLGDLLKRSGMPAVETEQLATWNPYNQNASADFFDGEWMFGIDDGFDVIIGNPPYLESRNSSFEKGLKDKLQRQLARRWGKDGRLIPRGSDLLVYFVETSIYLIRYGGVIVLITQNSWLDTDYGKGLQQFLMKKTCVQGIVDSDFKHFDSTDGPNVNTVITVFSGVRGSSCRRLAFIRFTEQPNGLPVSVRYPELIRERNLGVVKSYDQADPRLKNTKWGILLTADEHLLEVLDVLRNKGMLIDEIPNHRLSIGQGLNLSNDYVLTDESVIERIPSNALIPFMTSRQAAVYVLRGVDAFLIDGSKLGKSIPRLHDSGRIKAFNPKSTSKTVPLLLMPRGIGTKHFCALNVIGAFSASGVDVYDEASTVSTAVVANLWLFLNSSICWLLREISGRKNLGGGLLKAEATDLKQFPIYMDFQRLDEITSLIDRVSGRDVLEVPEEVLTDEHKHIDSIVFDFLETPQHLREHVVQSLVDSVVGRQSKSRRNVVRSRITEHTIRNSSTPSLSKDPQHLTESTLEEHIDFELTGTLSQRMARVKWLAGQNTLSSQRELVAALADESETIRWLAGMHLKQLGGPGVAGIVRAFLEQTDNPTAREEAQKVLDSLDGN